MKVKTLYTADGYSTVASRAKLSVQVEQRKRLGGWAKRVLVLDGAILYAYKTKGEGGSVSGWAVGGAEVAVSGPSTEGREDGRYMLTISRQHAYKITFALISSYEQARLIQALSSSGATVIGLEAILLLQDLRRQQEEEQERERKEREEAEEGREGEGRSDPKITPDEEDLFNVRWKFFEDEKDIEDSNRRPTGDEKENPGSKDESSKKKKTKAVRRHNSDSSSSSKKTRPKSNSVFYNSTSGLAYNPLYSSAVSLGPSGEGETSSTTATLRRSNTLDRNHHSLTSLSSHASVSSQSPSFSPSSETSSPRLTRSISFDTLTYKINPIPKPPRTGVQAGNPTSAVVVTPTPMTATPAYETYKQVEALGAQGHSPASCCSVRGSSSAVPKGRDRSEVLRQKEGELLEEGLVEGGEGDASILVNVEQVVLRSAGDIDEVNRRKCEGVKEQSIRLPPEGAENIPETGHQLEIKTRKGEGKDSSNLNVPWTTNPSFEQGLEDKGKRSREENGTLTIHTLELANEQTTSIPENDSSYKKETTDNYVRAEEEIYRNKERSVYKREGSTVYREEGSGVQKEEAVGGECEEKDSVHKGDGVCIVEQGKGVVEEKADHDEVEERVFRKKDGALKNNRQDLLREKQEVVNEDVDKRKEEEIVLNKEDVACQDELETHKVEGECEGRKELLESIRQGIIASGAEPPRDGYPLNRRPSDTVSSKRLSEGKPEHPLNQSVIASKVKVTDVTHESGEVLQHPGGGVDDGSFDEVGGDGAMRLERRTVFDKGSLRLLTSTDKDEQKTPEDESHHVISSNALPKGGGYSPPPPLFIAKEVKQKSKIEDNKEAFPSPRSSGREARSRLPFYEVSRIVKAPRVLEDRIHHIEGRGGPDKEDTTREKDKLPKLPLLRKVQEEPLRFPGSDPSRLDYPSSEGSDEEANGHQKQDLRQIERKNLENGSSSKSEEGKLKTSDAPEASKEPPKKKFNLFGFMSRKTKEKEKTSQTSPSSSRVSTPSPSPSTSTSSSSLSEEEDEGSVPGSGRSLRGVKRGKTSDSTITPSNTQPFSVLPGAPEKALAEEMTSPPKNVSSEGKSTEAQKEDCSKVGRGMSEETLSSLPRTRLATSVSPISPTVRRQISVDESSPVIISGHMEISGSLGGKWSARRVDVRGGHVLAYPQGATTPTTRISLKALSVAPSPPGPASSPSTLAHALCIMRGNRCMMALKLSSHSEMMSWLNALSDEVIRVTPEDQLGPLTLHPSSHDPPASGNPEDRRGSATSSDPNPSDSAPPRSPPRPPRKDEVKPKRTPPKTLALVRNISRSAEPSPYTSPVLSPSEGSSALSKSSSCTSSPVGKAPVDFPSGIVSTSRPEALDPKASTQPAVKHSTFHIPSFRKTKTPQLTTSSGSRSVDSSVQAGDADDHVTREARKATPDSRRTSDSALQSRRGSTSVRDAVSDLEKKHMQKTGEHEGGGGGGRVGGGGGGGKDGGGKWPSGFHAIEESIRNKINQLQSAVKEGVQGKKDTSSGNSHPRRLPRFSSGSFTSNTSSVLSSPSTSIPCSPSARLEDGVPPVFPPEGGSVAVPPNGDGGSREVGKSQHKPLVRLSGHGRRRSTGSMNQKDKNANFTNIIDGQPPEEGAAAAGVGSRAANVASKARVGGGEEVREVEAGEEGASPSLDGGSPAGQRQADPAHRPHHRVSPPGHAVTRPTPSGKGGPVTHSTKGRHGENPHPRLQRQVSITAELNEGDAGIAKITWSVAAVRERFETLSREGEIRSSKLTRQNSGIRRSGRGSLRKQRSTEGVVKRASIKRSGKRIDVSIRSPSSAKKVDKNQEEICLKPVRERMRSFETNHLLTKASSSFSRPDSSSDRKNSDSESSDPGIITSRSVNARPESICRSEVPPEDASTERQLLSPVSECSATSSDSSRPDVILCWKGPYISQETEQMVLTNISNAFLAKRRLQAKEALLVHLRERLGEVEEHIWDLQARMGELDNARSRESKDSNVKLNSEYSDLENDLRTAEQEATVWNTRLSRTQSAVAEARLKLAAALQAGLAQWSSTEDSRGLAGGDRTSRGAKKASRRHSGDLLQEIQEQHPCLENEASGIRQNLVESIENR